MKKILIWSISVITFGAIVTAVIWSNPLTPTVNLEDIEIATVDSGQVIRSVPANGIVEPENEVLLLSPATSVITEIVNGVGSKVNKGDVILRLDDKPIRQKIEDLQDQIEVKNNNLEKTLLNAKNVRVDLEYNVEVKKLKIISLKSQLEDQKQLLEVGGISPAKYEKTQQELTLAEKDLETIKTKNNIRLKQLATEEKGLRLQIEIQQKQLNEQKQLLDKMTIKAPSSGIILEINGKEGEKVNTDRLLVRMSDLTTFKLRATIDDQYANDIKTGRKVIAIIENDRLTGKIGTVSPTIKDRKIEFDVFLNQSDYSKLRPNMSVELLVVEAEKDNVLRVRKGEIFENQDISHIYKKNGKKGYRIPIKIGLIGDEYVEILEGASEGDELIISNIPALRKLDEIDII